MIHEQYYRLQRQQAKLITKKNRPDRQFQNGIFTRYLNPVITADHVPLAWRYDVDKQNNPYFLERLAVNSTFNAGAIYHNHKYVLAVRVEGADRKSFFGLASSDNGIDNFRFLGKPLIWDDIDPLETNVYDIRLTKHEDGYFYGLYCSESRDPEADPADTVAAIAKVGVVRTKDLLVFERLPNLITPAKQQRNVALHPEFVEGKYMLYTRPQDGFIEPGSKGGISYGFINDFRDPRVEAEYLIDEKRYHTNYELKNGIGPSPIKTARGWLHFAHGVRNTAAGLRYVIYLFVTSLENPGQTIAKPSGYLLSPYKDERIGDVSNVLFTNGVIVNEHEEVFLYYASADTRLHVAKSSIRILLDYAFNSPQEAYRSRDCVVQRLDLIDKNQRILSGATKNLKSKENDNG